MMDNVQRVAVRPVAASGTGGGVADQRGVGLATENAGKIRAKWVREVGENRPDVLERASLARSVHPLRELVQGEPAFATRRLEDFDHPFTVLVG